MLNGNGSDGRESESEISYIYVDRCEIQNEQWDQFYEHRFYNENGKDEQVVCENENGGQVGRESGIGIEKDGRESESEISYIYVNRLEVQNELWDQIYGHHFYSVWAFYYIIFFLFFLNLIIIGNI
jgi:hypothetical protein